MIDLGDARVTVMGLGRFGGGVGVTRYLADQGARVLVTDLAAESELSKSLESLEPLIRQGVVTTRLGGHNVSDFTNTDLVVANPAVPLPWQNRFLRAALAANVPITTEIGLLVSSLPAATRVIGVTGTVGKSTTCAMIAHGLRSVLGHDAVALGGNIGGSLLCTTAEREHATPFEWVVLELSSAMLFWLAIADKSGKVTRLSPSLEELCAPWFSPEVALVTNISANHCDWHGSFEHYAASKQALLRGLSPSAVMICADVTVSDWKNVSKARAIGPNLPEFAPRVPMALPGEHNRQNAAAALGVCVAALGESHGQRLTEAIGSFGGLSHRLEFVCERDGVRFYNDSKSTTPESCLRAIEAVASVLSGGARGVHLIAGGYDKKVSLELVARLGLELGGLYTIGETGPAIAAAAKAAGADALRVYECGTLEEAFANATERAERGGAILLSPACASWDQFTNFEARGEAFVAMARAWRAEA